MGTRSSTPDLLSLASDREPSSSSANPPSASPVITRTSSRHVLPADLSNAIKHLGNQELDRLLAAVLSERKRRGKKLPASDEISRERKVEAVSVPLTQGILNAGSRCLQSRCHALSELPDSSEFLNPMSGRRWRIIGEKAENELFRYTKSR